MLRIAKRLIGIAGCITLMSSMAYAATLGPLSTVQREERLDHAQELLGSLYKSSAVRVGEKVTKVNGAIYRWTRSSLSKKHKDEAPRIAQAVIDQAVKHGFDPIFLLALIQTESSFNPLRVGGVGELGLMQIRPETGEWIAHKAGLKWQGKKTLLDPVMNIKIGCAYLSWLREKFDSHARLYLAAYNMGQKNVRELLEQDKWPKDYPSRVMQVYVGFYEELRKWSV